MDTQVHNTCPLTCVQHKNFVNMSEIKQNQVTITPPSSLAPMKSRTETFWYRLTQIHLENGR